MMKVKKIAIVLLCWFAVGLVWAQGGGQDLGGGDTPVGERVPEETLGRSLLNYHQQRYALLNFVRMAGLVAQRILEILPRLNSPLPENEKTNFLQQAQLYQRMFGDTSTNIEVVQLVLADSCLDRAGQARDATAGVLTANALCFDRKRLAAKLTKENYELELLALYLHELSHLLGSNENEATLLQKQISGIGPNFKRYLGFLFQEQNLRSDLNAIISVASKIEIQDPQICTQLLLIKNNMLKFYQSNSIVSANIAILKFEQVVALHGAFVISQYLSDYCDGFASQMHKSKFPSEEALPFAALYPDPVSILLFLGPDQALIYSLYLFADLSPGKVFWQAPGDKEKLQLNLQQLLALLDIATAH